MNEETPQPPEITAPKHKNWKAYLFEFLLLFAAVSLGFFADNLRENFSDQQQGSEYIRSFYADLQTDTAIISGIIRHEEEKVSILNSVRPCWDSVSNNMPECVAMLARHSRVNNPFIMTERTFQQLVNVGGFRLLNKEDADSITQYMTLYRDLQDHQQTIYQECQANLRSTSTSLIHVATMQQIHNVTTNDPGFKLAPNTPVFASTDKVLINRFFNEMQTYQQVMISHVRQLKELKENQIRLLRYLNEQHGLSEL